MQYLFTLGTQNMKLPWCGLGGFITARPEMGTENLGKKKPVPQIVDSLMSLIGVKSPSQPSCFFYAFVPSQLSLCPSHCEEELQLAQGSTNLHLKWQIL